MLVCSYYISHERQGYPQIKLTPVREVVENIHTGEDFANAFHGPRMDPPLCTELCGVPIKIMIG